jgi:hypothetical protein
LGLHYSSVDSSCYCSSEEEKRKAGEEEEQQQRGNKANALAQ